MAHRSNQRLRKHQYDHFKDRLTNLLNNHGLDQSVISLKNIYSILAYIEPDKEALYSRLAKWCINYLNYNISVPLTTDDRCEILSITKATYYRWIKKINAEEVIGVTSSGGFIDRWGKFFMFSKQLGFYYDQSVCNICFEMIKENFSEVLDISLDRDDAPSDGNHLASKNIILVRGGASSSIDSREEFINDSSFYLYVQVGKCSNFLINILDQIQEQDKVTRTDYQVVESLDSLIKAMDRYRALDRVEIAKKLTRDGSVARVV